MRNQLVQVALLAAVFSALGCSASGANSTAAAKTAPAKSRTRLGEIKRIVRADSKRPAELAAKKEQVRAQPESGADSKRDISLLSASDGKKFQARIMRSADHHQQSGAYESWQSVHSLEPTFVDQEQGDEMIALASDANSPLAVDEDQSQQQQQQQFKVLPTVARPFSRAPLINQQSDNKAPQEVPEAPLSKNPARQQPADEYYSDDDEDDTDSPPQAERQFNGSSENSRPTGGEPKKAEHEQKRPQFGEHQPADERPPARSSYAHSSGQLDGGWLPKQTNSSLPTFASRPKSQAGPHEFETSEQQQAPLTRSPTRRPIAAEKLVNLFGRNGESSFSKTDMAIEYLRNILRTKQSSANSTSSGTIFSPIRNTTSESEFPTTRFNGLLDESAGRQLPKFNSVRETANVTSPGAQKSTETEQHSTGVFKPLQQFPAPDLSINAGESSRFLIDEAKPIKSESIVGGARAASSPLPQISPSPFAPMNSRNSSSTDAAPTSTTRLPSFSSSMMPSDPYYAKFQELSAGIPNGTPLGGDYIESADEFPRALHRQQEQQLQQQQQHLSRLQQLQQQQQQQQQADKGNDQQDTIAAQSSEHVSSSSEQSDKANAQQQHQSQLYGAPLVDPSVQFHQSAYRVPQPQSVPTSSRFFQMTHPTRQSEGPPSEALVGEQSGSVQSNQAPESHYQKQSVQQAAVEQLQHLKSLFALRESNTNNRYEAAAEPRPFASNSTAKSPPPFPAQPLPALYPVNVSEPPAIKTVSHSSLVRHNVESQQSQQHSAESPVQTQGAPISDKHNEQQPEQHYKQQQLHPPANARDRFVDEQPHELSRQQPRPPQLQTPRVEFPTEQQQQQQPQPKFKPPKIVSYNYFGSSSAAAEPASPSDKDRELIATNYQLGDALYTSSGGMDHLLSSSELEAIQSQFMTAEHPVVPLAPAAPANQNHQPREQQPLRSPLPHSNNFQPQPLPQPHHAHYNFDQDSSVLGGLLNNLKANNLAPSVLQKLQSPQKQAEEALKELASENEEQLGMVPPQQQQPPHQKQRPQQQQQQPISFAPNLQPEVQLKSPRDLGDDSSKSKPAPNVQLMDYNEFKKDKKKSLIVYLNHPKANEMSTRDQSQQDPSTGDQSADQPDKPLDPFVLAKEYDNSPGKDGKPLDLANLSEIKDAQDKDGLSVVVIGDAYKYKKIVLLISSKSGGLRFIPMVKDMKKK